MRYNISQNDRGDVVDLICGKITNTKIYNNIFYVTSTGSSYVDAGSLLWNSNTFYGQHPAGEPADPAKSTADPLMVGPGTATSISNAGGYRLRAGSPRR